MAKKIRVWDGTQWQDVAPALPYTAVHSAQASMPSTGIDGQIWLDTDGTLSDTEFVPLAGGTMTGNLNVPSINSGPIVGRNKIINGDFAIHQRSTTSYNQSTFQTEPYVADRVVFYCDVASGTRTVTRQTFTPGSAPVSGYEGGTFLRYSATVAETGATGNIFAQKIEDVRTLAGQTVTFSYWAKSDSNRQISVRLRQDFGSGGSAIVDTSTSTITTNTSWTRYTHTWTLASLSGKTIGTNSNLRIFIILPLNVVQTVDIWGWQLEAGSIATPFHTATPNQQTELAACQRYYWRTANTTAIAGYAMGMATATNYADFIVAFPVHMRTNPTTVDYSSLYVADRVSVAQSVTALTVPQSCSTSAILTAGVASGLTQYRPYVLENASSTAGYIGFSAEL